MNKIRYKKYCLYNIKRSMLEEKKRTLKKEDVKKLILKM